MKCAPRIYCHLHSAFLACRRGSALLITLAFVLLLTVLIVGFLSRVLLAHRISVSSSNQVKADVFAQGAEASIIGDLELEITSTLTPSNSTVPSWSPAAPNQIYFPNAPANMVPLYDYPGAPTGTNTPAATVANLLKVSTTAPAANSTFPTAASAPTTTPSLNGRYVSMNRWAESQMVDPTVYTNTATFPTPNWIMVTRSGTNTATFSSAVTFSNASKSSTSTIIGRYAYMIYDEGGLLDMNVAGRPYTTSSPLPTSLTSYPMGEATADLTQLTTSTGTAIMSTAQIDTLIGWRNNASVSPPAPTGSLTGPANLTPANATNYFNYLLGVSNGFLTTGNTAVYNSGTTYSTDSAFTSRLQLIQFMQQLLGTGTTNGPNGPTAMQYLTHFSRTLSQPSFCPPVNDPTVTGFTGTTTALASSPTSATNSAGGNDALINPAFLSTRVTGTFTRNDGSLALVGEPLVKKRFNLNRLAWITYAGPIWNSSTGTYNSNVATSYINALKTTNGFTDAFLKQGTAANIYNYFGLSWVSDTRTYPNPPGDNQSKWIYCHLNTNINPNTGSGQGPFASVTAVTSAYFTGSTPFISRLSALSAREPDFFELLKAGIAAGSKAKAATWQSGYPIALDPSPYQNNLDISLDNAIIQLGANIEDQFDLDGFPTRILFSDGSIFNSNQNQIREFDGVENLPYFYRIRAVPVVGRVPNPVYSGTVTVTTTPTFSQAGPGLLTDTTGSITDTGYVVFMEEPEVWNPFDRNSPRCALSSTGTMLLDNNGNPLCPTSFRLVVDSNDPDDVVPPGYAPKSITSSNFSTYNGSAALYGQVQASAFWNPGNYPQLQGDVVYGTTYATGTVVLNGVSTVLNGAPRVYFGTGPTGSESITDTLLPKYISTTGAGPVGLNTAATYGSATITPFTSVAQMTAPPFVHYAENSGIYFYINEASTGTAALDYFREPTLLSNYNVPAGSLVQPYGADNLLAASTTPVPSNHAPLSGSVLGTSTTAVTGTLSIGAPRAQVPLGCIEDIAGYPWTGIYLGTVPLAFYCASSVYPPSSPYWTNTGPGTHVVLTQGTNLTGTFVNPWQCAYPNNWDVNGANGAGNALTVRIQYYNGNPGSLPPASNSTTASNWATYDTKYANILETHDAVFNLPGVRINSTSTYTLSNYNSLNESYYNVAYDPRTSRFGMPYGGAQVGSLTDVTPVAPGSPQNKTNLSATYGWIDIANRALVSERPDYSTGFFQEFYKSNNEFGPTLYTQNLPGSGGTGTTVPPQIQPPDWVLGGTGTSTASTGFSMAPFGMFAQNLPSSTSFSYNNAVASSGSNLPTPYADTETTTNSNGFFYYADPDHIVRRGMASYMTTGNSIGQPLAQAYTGTLSGSGQSSQLQSRPIVLNRPFKTVGELGYCFSGTPWKNIDFSNPESGDSALLDVFCVGDNCDANGMMAGKVNLNTQQAPVIQAILAGAYKDDQQNNYSSASAPSWALSPLSSTEASSIASDLVHRTVRGNTTAGTGPLRNVAELVGRYTSLTAVSGDPDSPSNYDGSKSFSGFSGDSGLTSAFSDTTGSGAASSTARITRLRESATRALSSAGQTRVWNLLIDLVAQTGEYPPTATSFNQFAVQGEQRYWIHLAIDRYTGQVIDKQVEVLKE
jgi:hypothetical protein